MVGKICEPVKVLRWSSVSRELIHCRVVQTASDEIHAHLLHSISNDVPSSANRPCKHCVTQRTRCHQKSNYWPTR